jgi:hypothetical protein
MLTILENPLIGKHHQAMIAPPLLRMLLALTCHFDNAFPEPHDDDVITCTAFIRACNGNGILLKFMKPQHAVTPCVDQSNASTTCFDKITNSEFVTEHGPFIDRYRRIAYWLPVRQHPS